MDIYNISISGTSCNLQNLNYELFTGDRLEHKNSQEIIDPKYSDIINIRVKNLYN
jgi:hypothetical protein